MSGTHLHTREHVYGCFIIKKIISQSCYCLYAYICTLTWDTLSGDTVIRSFTWAWYFFWGLKGKMSLCTEQCVMVYFSCLCFIIKKKERIKCLFFFFLRKTIIKGAFLTCNYLQLEFRSGRCLNPWWKCAVSSADALSGHSLLGSMGLCWGRRCQALCLPSETKAKDFSYRLN